MFGGVLTVKLIEHGRISSVNPENHTARIVITDRDNMVSGELPILHHGVYWLPEVGDTVACIMMPNSKSMGFIIGAFYNQEDKPPVNNKNKHHIRFNDGASFEYDSGSHELVFNGVSGSKFILRNCEFIRE